MFPVLSPRIRNVTVLFTNRCNISCTHCYVSSNPSGHFGLPVALVKDIIDVTALLPGNPLFTLSGGEPLSRKKDCLEILHYAAGRVKTQVLTNGMLITPAIAEQLRDLGVLVRISLDGYTAAQNDAIRGNGTYDKIKRGIGNLFDAGFPASDLAICSTMVHIEPQVITQYLQLCEEMGVEHIRFHALCRLGRGAALAGDQYGAEDDTVLHANKTSFVRSFDNIGAGIWDFESLDTDAPVFNEININSDGSVYPYVVYDHRNPRSHEIAAGNVLTDSFDAVIRSQKMAESLLVKFLALNISSRSLSRAFLASRKKLQAATHH